LKSKVAIVSFSADVLEVGDHCN